MGATLTEQAKDRRIMKLRQGKIGEMPTMQNTQNEKVGEAVSQFSAYCDELQSILAESLKPQRVYPSLDAVTTVLNGQAGSALQRLVPADVRKQAGIFFTGTGLAERVAERLSPLLRSGVEICDPACGAGNLLLACCRHLPRGETVQETLRMWSRLVKGCDLFPEFVVAARLRLTIAAVSIHGKDGVGLGEIDTGELFRGLRVADAFSSLDSASSKVVVVNPPFGYMEAPEGCRWARGKIQIAGWFMERLLRMAAKGQQIAAILPDVLRSGSRYRRWRELVGTLVSDITVESAGRFDEVTDVDVFILRATACKDGSISAAWPEVVRSEKEPTSKVSDYFDIHVGSVVPHRDRNEGKSYPYIHARTAVAWQTLEHVNETRQSGGRVFAPPFVVVHRTSSPADRNRCVGSIVNEISEVAVENHLIVLSPKDGTLQSCQQLLKSLQSSATNEWLNRRIRCRHLTVSALADLPYFEKE